MKEYIICFHQNGKFWLEFDNVSEEVVFNIGDMRKVSEREMFAIMEIAHRQDIKLSIYTAILTCDLT